MPTGQFWIGFCFGAAWVFLVLHVIGTWINS